MMVAYKRGVLSNKCRGQETYGVVDLGTGLCAVGLEVLLGVGRATGEMRLDVGRTLVDVT